MPEKTPLGIVEKLLAADGVFLNTPLSPRGERVRVRGVSDYRKTTRLISRRLAPILLCLCLLTIASPAQAHRVLVYAYAEGDTIHAENKFVGSGPVKQGRIQVRDKKTGQVLLTGTTDDQGKFSFKIPPAAAAGRLDLLIVAEASMGHQGEWLLKADSYLPGAQTKAAAAAPVVSAPVAPSTSPSAGTGGKAISIDQQALEAALDKSLEAHLAPIQEKLTELTIHRVSLTEIIGGIGFIVGIFGLWAYFMSKRKPNP